MKECNKPILNFYDFKNNVLFFVLQVSSSDDYYLSPKDSCKLSSIYFYLYTQEQILIS